MKDRLKWLGHVLWMKGDRLPKIVFLAIHLGQNKKQFILEWGWGEAIRKDFKEEAEEERT